MGRCHLPDKLNIGENFNSLEIRFNKNIESEKNLKADLV